MKNAVKRPKDLLKPPSPTATWLDNGIKTVDDLKSWILIKLGQPTTTVELTDEQLDTCIFDAMTLYSKYAYRPEKYLALNLKYYEPGRGIDLSEFKVMSVKQVSLPHDNMMGAYGDMFFSPYAFFGQGAQMPFFNGNASGPSGNWVGAWTSFQACQEFFQLSREMTGNNPDFQYDKNTKRLVLMPEPRRLNQCILATCNVVPPIEDYLSDDYFRRLALAECKILLGTVRSKFQNVPLPGGGSLDTSVGDQGRDEKQSLLEELIKSESRGQFFIAN